MIDCQIKHYGTLRFIGLISAYIVGVVYMFRYVFSDADDFEKAIIAILCFLFAEVIVVRAKIEALAEGKR